MSFLPRYLLPSEQIAAWKKDKIDLPRRLRKFAAQNAASSDTEIKSYLKGHFCSKPFDTMETLDDGLVNVCCPDWLPTPIGKIDDMQGAWTGRPIQKIRESIIDGSFRYCSHLNCSLISGRHLARRDSKPAQALIARFERDRTAPPPRELKFSHDRSCNLSCPSCRTQMIVARKDKQKRLDDQLERSFLPILEKARSVYITGSGDPFGSAHFRRMIKRLNRQDFPNLRFKLHTNAQLWDERAWRDLDLAGRVETVQISIDAADAETYAVVRRGGTYARLLKNLEYVKVLRQSGEIPWLEISMVVQALNFREMPAFVRLGRSIEADSVIFEMIRDWGVYTPEEFKSVQIKPSHPGYAEFLRVLEHPDMRDPRVSASNVTENVRLNELRAVA